MKMETMEDQISIPSCISRLTKHYLELYMNRNRAIVLHVKYSEKKYKKLRCIAFRKLYMKLHSPYIFPTTNEVIFEKQKHNPSKDAFTELSKVLIKLKLAHDNGRTEKLMKCIDELKTVNSETINSVLHLLLCLSDTKDNVTHDQSSLNYEKWIIPSRSKLPDLFQFDKKSSNIFDEKLYHFNSSSGFNQDVFKSNMNSVFIQTPNHNGFVLDEYLGKQQFQDAYENEIEVSLFSGLTSSFTSSIHINLTIPDLPANPNNMTSLREFNNSRASSDEGFHELSSLSTSPEPHHELPATFDNLKIWDKAMEENSQMIKWKAKSKTDGRMFKNYLTESGRTAFDCMFNLSISSIERMTGRYYKVTVISEKIIFQHSKSVLIGIPSSTYLFHTMSCSIHPITNIRCSGISDDSLYGLMNKFANIGTSFSRLNKFCFSHTEKLFVNLSGGLILKAFVDGVQKILQSFSSAVFAIEDDEELTLMQLWQLFERYGNQLKFLCDICLCTEAFKPQSKDSKKPKFPVGANLLSYLYTLAIENSSTDNSMLLLYLFKAVSKIYIRFVRNWLFNGSCEDPYNEFFVQVDEQYLHYRDKHYWTQGFQMKETKNAIPLYLDSLADQIYSCGKALNLLKLINIKHFMFDQEIKPPEIGITFSSTKLDAIETENKQYLQTVYKCEENYIALKEKEKLEKEQMFKEKLERERQSVKVVSDRIEALEKKVRDAIRKKKQEQFDELKQQFDDAIKLRKEMKAKKLEEDKYWLNEIRKQEKKEDAIRKKAKEDLIAYYEKLTIEAEKREFRARWFIQRHELSSKRNEFFRECNEKEKLMSADDEDAKKIWITQHVVSSQQMYSQNKREYVEQDSISTDPQSDGSSTQNVRRGQTNFEGENMKSLIYSTEISIGDSSNVSKKKIDGMQNEGTDAKNLIYGGNVVIENATQSLYNTPKWNDGEETKNILYPKEESASKELVKCRQNPNADEGAETKSLLYPSEGDFFDVQYHVSEHGNEGSTAKNLIYPDETDSTPDEFHSSRGHHIADGEKAKNIIYGNDEIEANLFYHRKQHSQLEGSDAKASLYNEDIQTNNPHSIKEFEKPSVMQDFLYRNEEEMIIHKTKEYEKPSVMQEILYDNAIQEYKHVTKEFEPPSVMQNILYSEDDGDKKEHFIKNFETPSVMKDIIYSDNITTNQTVKRNFRGFEPETKIKHLLYPVIEGKATKRYEMKELTEDEVWMDSIVEPFRDDYRIMDCDPQPNLFGDCEQFVSPFIDELKDLNADIIKKLPLETIIRRSLTVPILSQISLVNKALVNYFLIDLNIKAHFDAFRKFLLLEDGEFGHSLCNQLFKKVASGMKASDFCNTIALGNVISEAIGISLYASSIEYSDQLKFATKWMPEVLQPSDIGVLDFLELRYRVPWPCNIVVTENSITKYNKVFSFLLRLKKAGWSLQNVFINLKRAANSRKAACSPQLRQLQLFRHEMLHFVNNLERYVVNQIIHVSWQEFRVDLSVKVQSLDDLHKCHVNYLSKIIFRSLLSKNAEPVYKFINDIFSMISKFETRLSATPWQHEYRSGYVIHPLFEKLKTVHAAFKQSAEFLFKVISKLAKRGYQEHLGDLLLQVNFNSYYTLSVSSR